MTIKRHEVLVVDIESTCWEKQQAPEGQISEIIEIGICRFDMTQHQAVEKRSILVQPSQSEISPFCTELTSLTPELIASDGISFADACQILRRDYESEARLWLSWGNYDRRMFIEQCERQAIDYPFSEQHCNLKNLYANFYGRRAGMAEALNKLRLDLIGTHHRGADDAWNIARILAYLLKEYGDDLLESFW